MALEDQPVVVPDLVDTDLPGGQRKTYIFYSPEIGSRILDLYMSGMSLAEIARQAGLPGYQTILKWSKDSSKFAAEFERARQARAIYFEDQVAQIATGAPASKDEVAGERLRFDALVKVAEWGDPNRFGKKVTVAGDQSRPIVFKVVTGVPDNPYQQPPELNSDGTQRKLEEPHSSVAEQPGGASPSAPADGGSIPPAAPNDPELEPHD